MCFEFVAHLERLVHRFFRLNRRNIVDMVDNFRFRCDHEPCFWFPAFAAHDMDMSNSPAHVPLRVYSLTNFPGILPMLMSDAHCLHGVDE